MLPFCCICIGWWAEKPLSHTYSIYFNCPLNYSFPGFVLLGGGEVDCVSKKYFLKDKSTLKKQKLIARNKNCERRIPECFLYHPSL